MNKKLMFAVVLGIIVIASAFVVNAERISKTPKLDALKLRSDASLKTEIQDCFNETGMTYDKDDQRFYFEAEICGYEAIGDEIINKTISMRHILNVEDKERCYTMFSKSVCEGYLEGEGYDYIEVDPLGEENRTIHVKGKQETWDAQSQRIYEKSKKLKLKEANNFTLTRSSGVSLNA